tara:strand:- start:35 stop:895 length:861 start_codon:yes stop_codon:yes gene_type:complete
MNNENDLQIIIEENWDNLCEGKEFSKNLKKTIDSVLSSLDKGEIRVCEKKGNIWIVNQWIKKTILLSFRINSNMIFNSGIQNSRSGKYCWYDKVDLKTSGWNEDAWSKANFRSVPGATIRFSSYIAPNVVLMPCFVNIGAYVDSGSMIDTWATVGSCAQIGKNVHISGGAGIGGVLEPLQANPVVIEDNCFIGARSEVAEGVIVGKGSVLSMGVFIGLSTKIVKRETGEIFFGEVPPYSVVVPGTLPSDKSEKSGIVKPDLACAVIVKTVDEKTRSKTSINELLRS